MKNVYIYPEWKKWENNYIEKLGKDKVVDFLEELGFYDIHENYYTECSQNDKPASYNFNMRTMKNMDYLFIRMSDFDIELFARGDVKEEFKPKEMPGLKEMWRDYMSDQFSDYRNSLKTYLTKKDNFYNPQYETPLYR